MKKTTKLLLMLVMLAFVISCDKEEEDPSYELAQFLGTWELQSSTSEDFVACPDDPPIIVIGEDEIELPVYDTDTGCLLNTTPAEYTFNGKEFVITLFGIDVTYEITAYSETTFSWRDNFGIATETYVKVQ